MLARWYLSLGVLSVSIAFFRNCWLKFQWKIAKVEQSFDLVSICHVGAVWLGPSFVTFSWQEIVQRRRWQLSKPLIVANLAQVAGVQWDPNPPLMYDDWIWSIEFWSLSHANGQVGPNRFVQGVFAKIDTWRPSTSGGCRSNASSPLPSPRPPSSPLLVLTAYPAYPLNWSREKIHGYWGLVEMVCQAHPYPGAMIWNRQYHQPMHHIRSRDNWGLMGSMCNWELGYRRTLQLHWRMLPWSHA